MYDFCKDNKYDICTIKRTYKSTKQIVRKSKQSQGKETKS